MSSKKIITALSKAGSESGVASLQNALKNNPMAIKTSYTPNAARLKDGAIQRASVQPIEGDLKAKLNPEKIGVSKRPHQGVSSSSSAMITGDAWADVIRVQGKTARIYMPQKKHVHNHAADKTMGNYWVIDFDTESTFKSPLM